MVINGTPILKGDHYPLRRFMIPDFLMYMIYLEPLNLFLYTWRFMRELEQEEKNHLIKNFYKWFPFISILILPVAFVCIVIAYTVETAKYDYYVFHREFNNAYQHGVI